MTPSELPFYNFLLSQTFNTVINFLPWLALEVLQLINSFLCGSCRIIIFPYQTTIPKRVLYAAIAIIYIMILEWSYRIMQLFTLTANWTITWLFLLTLVTPHTCLVHLSGIRKHLFLQCLCAAHHKLACHESRITDIVKHKRTQWKQHNILFEWKEHLILL